jgi:SAM-dependent methyltransferase
MPSRSVTSPINWILDNLLPPALRDSRLFMTPLFRALFGARASDFMRFKEEAPFLTKREFRGWYERLASSHIRRESDLTPEALEAVLEAVVGDQVLDVGAGRGFLARRLAERAAGLVVGVDLFASGGAGRAHLLRADGEALPFRDGAFDTVTCCHTLEHVQDAEAAVAELRRVARRRLVVVVPRQREYAFTFDLHVRFFPYAFSLHQLMRRPGASCRVVRNDFVYVEELPGGR